MNLKRIFIGTMVSLLMFSCGGKKDTSVATNPEYPVMALSKQDATLETVYPTTIKGVQDVDIRPRIDGWIEEIYVDEGSVVKAGQRMFKINSPQAEAAYRTAKAAVNSAEAQMKTAQLDVDRVRPLAEKGIVSEVQLSTYKNVYETAAAGLVQAQASLTNAQATLSWATVTSPVSGIVGELPFRKGNLVNSANALTTVANNGTVYAYFNMNEKAFMSLMDRTEGDTQAEKIKNFPEVSLRLSDGSTYPKKGRIETISGSISRSTGSINFRAAFPNEGGLLRSGLSGRLHLPEAANDVFVIPQRATFNQQDKVIVYKVQGDSAVQQLINVLDMPDGQHYAVTGGLNVGEKIITGNIATLRPNMHITPVVE